MARRFLRSLSHSAKLLLLDSIIILISVRASGPHDDIDYSSILHVFDDEEQAYVI
jgi:hypothetical protein